LESNFETDVLVVGAGPAEPWQHSTSHQLAAEMAEMAAQITKQTLKEQEKKDVT